MSRLVLLLQAGPERASARLASAGDFPYHGSMAPTAILFDLDNTLYPANCGLLERVDARFNDYIAAHLSLSLDAVRALRRRYSEQYGTTLCGLRAEHDLDIEAFLAYAHDPVPMDDYLIVDEELLAALAAIELEKVVFTNAPSRWARRVLAAMRLTEQFHHVCDLDFMAYHTKPSPEAFQCVLAHLNRRAEECVLVEDTPRNLVAAKELGMTTVLVGAAPLSVSGGFCGGNGLSYVDYWITRPSQVTEVLAELTADGREQ